MVYDLIYCKIIYIARSIWVIKHFICLTEQHFNRHLNQTTTISHVKPFVMIGHVFSSFSNLPDHSLISLACIYLDPIRSNKILSLYPLVCPSKSA